jgi:phosphoglycolate phosphatase
MLKAILFDLDGTLADTAPDLAYALNLMRDKRGLPPLPDSMLRAHASSGARGLIGVGLGIQPGDAAFESAREEFLDNYQIHLARSTRLFSGVTELLSTIESQGLSWGIVTNKSQRFTQPVLQALALADRAACSISGDTTAHAKPHPAPMRAALEALGVSAAECYYVGDDERDVQAGHASGIEPVIALYGYLGNGKPPDQWGARLSIKQPLDLLNLLPTAPSMG